MYYITDFGAKAGNEICTKQIQKAIDECFLAGGGEVVIPCGNFLTGGLRIRSNVTLHLMEGAILTGSTDPEDYCAYLDDKIEPVNPEDLEKVVDTSISQSRSVKPYSRWNNAIVRAINAKNVAIIGEKMQPYPGKTAMMNWVKKNTEDRTA
ncbi:MAG: hypothetical protein IJE10_01460 [Clostridia bacterium]|nr:hypothetical protein [Clostridia bacterium]